MKQEIELADAQMLAGPNALPVPQDETAIRRELGRCEEVIAACQQKEDAGFVKKGKALREIREQRLYQLDYSSFDKYCQAKWGFSDARASQLILAAEQAEELLTVNPGLTLPHEKLMRSISDQTPEQQIEIIQSFAALPPKLRRGATGKFHAKDKKEKCDRKLATIKETERAALLKYYEELQGNPPWTITADQSVIDVTGGIVLTDPPQGLLDGEDWDPKSVQELETLTRDWTRRWNECGADAFVIFWSEKFLFEGRRWFDESLTNYEYHFPLLHWVYRNDTNFKAHNRFQSACDPIFIYLRKESKRKFGFSGSRTGGEFHNFNWHQVHTPTVGMKEQDCKQHPCQKPIEICRWLISGCTGIGELIVDVFAGSASIGVGACQLGRRYYGIEQLAKYRELSERRLATYGQLDVEYQKLQQEAA